MLDRVKEAEGVLNGEAFSKVRKKVSFLVELMMNPCRFRCPSWNLVFVSFGRSRQSRRRRKGNSHRRRWISSPGEVIMRKITLHCASWFYKKLLTSTQFSYKAKISNS